jgi:hypothetical protein
MTDTPKSRSTAGPHHIGLVERTAKQVDYIEVRDESPEVPAAWERLEGIVGELRGRHFVGAFRTGRYRACVEVDVDSPRLDSLQRGELPGGLYARIRVRGDSTGGLYLLLPDAFEELRRSWVVDEERPSLEVYRRHDQIDALVPLVNG